MVFKIVLMDRSVLNVAPPHDSFKRLVQRQSAQLPRANNHRPSGAPVACLVAESAALRREPEQRHALFDDSQSERPLIGASLESSINDACDSAVPEADSEQVPSTPLADFYT